MLDMLAPELAPIVHAIFTQSLDTVKLPRDWSLTNVTPIFKKGNRVLVENYRPVTLTCITCKLFEHIVCRHILDHVKDHKILTNLQHGFRSGRSCETRTNYRSVPRIWQGGGARIFFSDLEISPCALLGGLGACSSEKMFLNGAIWYVLVHIWIQFCL